MVHRASRFSIIMPIVKQIPNLHKALKLSKYPTGARRHWTDAYDVYLGVFGLLVAVAIHVQGRNITEHNSGG